jgi:hypothetical protein
MHGGLWVLAGLALGLVSLLVMFMRLSFRGGRTLRIGKVTGVIGRKGHGKSLFLVHEMLRSAGQVQLCPICTNREGHRVTHRITVASNCELQLPAKLQPYYRFIDCWDDLYDLPHMTLAVVDEIGMAGWAPADQTYRLPKKAVWFLAQCRKLGIEFMWCAQREDRVTVGLRSQTDEVGYCARGYLRTMRVRFVEPEDVPKLRSRAKGFRPDWVYRYRVTRRLARAYNTFQLVAHDEPAPEMDDAETVNEQKPRKAPGRPKLVRPAQSDQTDDSAETLTSTA